VARKTNNRPKYTDKFNPPAGEARKLPIKTPTAKKIIKIKNNLDNIKTNKEYFYALAEGV